MVILYVDVYVVEVSGCVVELIGVLYWWEEFFEFGFVVLCVVCVFGEEGYCFVDVLCDECVEYLVYDVGDLVVWWVGGGVEDVVVVFDVEWDVDVCYVVEVGFDYV